MLGRSLGNYGVVSKIGEGGMGVVYLARHVTLGRQAAIKVLRPALSSNQDVVSRFFNEARAVTAVKNSGIVEVYDFGFLEDRTAYIIMEYLDGESLAARLRRGRPTIAVTLTIVRAMARSLQAAHEHGIVHRDLKPDNVFLVPDSELPSGERVKLLDFGIAKLADRAGDAYHTTTGTVMGTPTYMAPEQCRGVGSVDHRADLYSLGCVAYEMLCGQPPFVAPGPGDMIARHLYFEPPRPRSHRSDLPAEIEEIILRLLQKEPRARYSNAAELVRAIDQLSVATPRAVSRSEPLPTEFVATLPVMRDTTLNGAASSSEISRRKPSRPRLLVLVGAAAFALAFLVVIIVVVTREARDGEIGANVPAAPRTTESIASENGPSHVGPQPSAVTHQPADAGANRAPRSDSQPSAREAPELTTPRSSGMTPGGAATPPGVLAPSTVSPGGTKLDAPAAPTSPDATSHPAPAPAPASATQSGVITASGGVTSGDPAGSNAAAASEKPSERTAPVAESPTVSTPGPAVIPNGTPPHVDSRAASNAARRNAPKPGEPPAATAPTGPSETECTATAFAPVLDAKVPTRTAVKSARNLLARCKALLNPDIYEDIHRRLIGKY